MNAADWEFWIDVGGTFTDCLARRPDGSIATHKLLSSGIYKGEVSPHSTPLSIRDPLRTNDPPDYFTGYRLALFSTAEHNSSVPLDNDVPIQGFNSNTGELHVARPLQIQPSVGLRYELSSDEEAPISGIRWLMKKRLGEEIGPVRIKLGTTRATNALLERQGAATALVTTAGFRDVLRIGYQNRPHLFNLHIRKPSDLYREVVEINERLDRDGNVLHPLDKAKARAALEAVKAKGIQSLAVCLMHAYRNDVHERLIEDIAHEIGFKYMSLSSRVSPLPKIVSRGETTAIDAYLTPILRTYCVRIAAQAPQASLKFMTSAGSLAGTYGFMGKDAILSGPAGGVVGAANVAGQTGFNKIIGFDMGGTSTDVSRFDGRYERRYEMEMTNPQDGTKIRVVAPMLSVETVAAGGGSICWFDGQKPVVGPRSAGSNPGPACYGRGGPLCVTDVNLFLGKMLSEHFPFPLNRNAVVERLDALINEIANSTGRRYTREELAAGFTAIANANMTAPIRQISIARGYDAREYTLVSFGGAGAQHACAIARELGIPKILCSPYSGVLSALGIGVADVTKLGERAVNRLYDELLDENGTVTALEPIFSQLQRSLYEQVLSEGIAPERIRLPLRLLDMRYAGQESRITVPCPADGDYRKAFERLHHQLYGFTFPQRPVEVYAARVEFIGETEKLEAVKEQRKVHGFEPAHFSQTYFNGSYQKTPVYRREQLQSGEQVTGPAIIVEPISTVVIEPDWTAEVTEQNNLLLTFDQVAAQPHEADKNVDAQAVVKHDPIELELFNNHFASIAEQMGATLQKTALSTNVKERLDFSCAIFSPNGDLVVNAPHIPVHLGAMSECVKRLMTDVGTVQPGDLWVTNDPFRGGSHLPDVTVITPVFGQNNTDAPLFFTASRAHHAEIGGITPGSMPPFSRTLAEEGVLIRHFRLMQDNRSGEEALRELLSSGPYPSRAVAENIADINAQVAANQSGVQSLLEMVNRYGLEKVQSYMTHIQRAAENKMRTALLKIPAGEHTFKDMLDDGSPLCVSITVSHNNEMHGGEAVIDFSGTGPVMEGNLNANSAIVTSAVLYCFRCLIDEDIPLNAGVLAPLQIKLPDNCLLNPPIHDDPAKCAAVVGGNVETSQRVVDVIFGALKIVAASQGTMNNFLFGRSSDGASNAFGYYETICGGAGAGPNFDGADAIHTHMTNTRLTDPEVIEARYPVRLLRCEIRPDSGGVGLHQGGNGIIREVEFLEPLDVSLLTSRRSTQPYGLAGGHPGLAGRNSLKRKGSNTYEELGGTALIKVETGDVLRIETPGGGGYGAPLNTNEQKN